MSLSRILNDPHPPPPQPIQTRSPSPAAPEPSFRSSTRPPTAEVTVGLRTDHPNRLSSVSPRDHQSPILLQRDPPNPPYPHNYPKPQLNLPPPPSLKSLHNPVPDRDNLQPPSPLDHNQSLSPYGGDNNIRGDRSFTHHARRDSYANVPHHHSSSEYRGQRRREIQDNHGDSLSSSNRRKRYASPPRSPVEAHHSEVFGYTKTSDPLGERHPTRRRRLDSGSAPRTSSAMSPLADISTGRRSSPPPHIYQSTQRLPPMAQIMPHSASSPELPYSHYDRHANQPRLSDSFHRRDSHSYGNSTRQPRRPVEEHIGSYSNGHPYRNGLSSVPVATMPERVADTGGYESDGHSDPASDLAASEEVWHEELGRYVLETRRRAKEVERWFEEKGKDQNIQFATSLDKRYSKPHALPATISRTSHHSASSKGRPHERQKDIPRNVQVIDVDALPDEDVVPRHRPSPQRRSPSLTSSIPQALPPHRPHRAPTPDFGPGFGTRPSYLINEVERDRLEPWELSNHQGQHVDDARMITAGEDHMHQLLRSSGSSKPPRKRRRVDTNGDHMATELEQAIYVPLNTSGAQWTPPGGDSLSRTKQRSRSSGRARPKTIAAAEAVAAAQATATGDTEASRFDTPASDESRKTPHSLDRRKKKAAPHSSNPPQVTEVLHNSESHRLSS